MSVEPFVLLVPDADLEDLRRRLAATRWPDQPDGEPWAYGSDVTYLRELAGYWSECFDWRAGGGAELLPPVPGG